jgi:hypothetical protein
MTDESKPSFQTNINARAADFNVSVPWTHIRIDQNSAVSAT